MKIQDLLRKDVMLLDLQATEKTAAIEEMIHSLVEHGYVTDFETFKEGILAREALTSTGLYNRYRPHLYGPRSSPKSSC